MSERHRGEAGSDAKRWRAALAACLLAGLLARAAVLAWAAAGPERFDYPDSRRYVAVARNIAAGRGPIDSAEVRCGTDPLYPALLAVGRRLGIESDAGLMNWGRAVNGALGLMAIPAVMLLARRAAGIFAAWAAGLLMAMDPMLVFFHALVLTEVPYLCLLVWGIELLLRARESRRLAPAAAAGVVFGLAALTRSSGLFLPLLLLLLLLAGREQSARHSVARVAVFLGAMVVALAPVALRNYRLLGKWVPLRTGSGASLLEAWGPWADGGPGMERVTWPAYPPGANEADRDRACREAAVSWARANPRRAVDLAWVKLRRTWSVTPHAPGYTSAAYAAVGWLTVAPVYGLAVAGACLLRRQRALLWALLAPAVYFSAVHCVFVGSVRYRIPAMPGLFVLAAVTIAWLLAGRGGRGAPRVPS